MEGAANKEKRQKEKRRKPKREAARGSGKKREIGIQKRNRKSKRERGRRVTTKKS